MRRGTFLRAAGAVGASLIAPVAPVAARAAFPKGAPRVAIVGAGIGG